MQFDVIYPVCHTGMKRLHCLIRIIFSGQDLIIDILVGTLVFNFYPLVVTFVKSLCNMKGDFIGIVNYKIMFESAEFRQSVVNTIYMAILGVGLTFWIAVLQYQ